MGAWTLTADGNATAMPPAPCREVGLESDPAATGARKATLPHAAAVMDVEFDASGTLLLTGSANGIVRLWDASTRELVDELATGGRVL